MSIIEYKFEQYNSLAPSQYKKEKYNLQVELLKLQEDVISNKRKIAICFEGRDTAGKSSTINFFSEHLIPSNFKYVHLGIPSPEEKNFGSSAGNSIYQRVGKSYYSIVRGTPGH